jgi:hypothetical protein
MPTMPTREALLSEFNAAVQQIDQARSGSNLTSDFYARIGDSVFDAGYSALADTCDHGGQPRSPAKTKEPHRLHVVSAPVGSGKTSFAMALIASVVRLQQRCEDAPFGCLWVVDQMTKADEMYRDLNQLLPGKVAVWSTDQSRNLRCCARSSPRLPGCHGARRAPRSFSRRKARSLRLSGRFEIWRRLRPTDHPERESAITLVAGSCRC